MQTLTHYETELTTECTCTYLDDNDNEQPSYDCYGCFDDAKEWLNENLTEWQNANGYDDDTLIRIEADGLGWRRLSGFIDCRVSEIAQALSINGDYRIIFKFSLDFKTLSAVRYSHDEPTGTGKMVISKSPFDECAYCREIDNCQTVNGFAACTVCYEMQVN